MNLRLGSWSRALAPGYGWCLRCKTPWRFVEGHSTPFEFRTVDLQAPDGTVIPNGGDWQRSCFPLCERCWAELTPVDRLPYYHELWWDWWKAPEDQPWEPLRDAVMAGR
jgi:hypothetical protein